MSPVDACIAAARARKRELFRSLWAKLSREEQLQVEAQGRIDAIKRAQMKGGIRAVKTDPTRRGGTKR